MLRVVGMVLWVVRGGTCRVWQVRYKRRLIYLIVFSYFVFFAYKVVGLYDEDCEYEAGNDEEVPGDAEHAEYGGVFD